MLIQVLLTQRMLLRSFLSREGFDVDVAADGVEAVAAANRAAYDLIVMDGFMPGQTGWDATREIRAAEAAAAGSGGVSGITRRPAVIIGVTGEATTAAEVGRCIKKPLLSFVARPGILQQR